MDSQILQEMEKVWMELGKAPKPDLIYVKGEIIKLASETSQLWENVVSPDIYQIFPSLLRKK